MKIIGKIDSESFIVAMSNYEIVRACGYSHNTEPGFRALTGEQGLRVGLELNGSHAFRIADSVERFTRAVRDIGEIQTVALNTLRGIEK